MPYSVLPRSSLSIVPFISTTTPAIDAPLGNIKGEVTIHTNDPDQPEIKVPVFAYVG